MHIIFRQTDGTVLDGSEVHYGGEPFYDYTNVKFGIFTGASSTKIAWYPSVKDDNFILNPSQLLKGFVNDYDTENNVYASFTTQNAFKIVDSINGEIASFTFGELSISGNMKIASDKIYKIGDDEGFTGVFSTGDGRTATVKGGIIIGIE